MNVTPLFPSFLATEDTSEIINVNSIHEYCKINGDGNTDAYSKELLPLTNRVTEQANNLRDLQGIKNDIPIVLDDCWINCIGSNDKHSSPPNFPHSHSTSWISFVYYVNYTRDAGSLVLMSPHQNTELTIPRKIVTDHNVFNAVHWSVPPSNGLLVAFPGWLKHYVEPNHSNETRISIAYNFSLQ
jgi:uncharacterized protein (TIGR02466 family)